MSRWARRIDRAQPAIVRDLRAMGYGVLHTHSVGKTAPDLVVAKAGVNVLVEIKTPGREKHDPAHIKAQRDAQEAWPGEWITATSAADIVDWFRRMHGVVP